MIFLDFDGVLNSDKYVRNYGSFGLIIDSSRMTLLKQIVDATDAKIVLSTSWREHWGMVESDCDNIGIEINQIFRKYELEVFDKTPQLNFKREQEILQWLKDYPSVTNFVILDDRFINHKLLNDHFVWTSNLRDGLNEEDVKKAITILNEIKKGSYNHD